MKTKKSILTGRGFKVSVFIIVFLCSFLAAPYGLTGQTAGIQDILVTVQKDRLLVFGRLTNCFTKDMESAIMAGVPTTFTFHVDLYQQRSWWSDKKVAATVIKQTLKYDSLKNTFYMTSAEGKDLASFQNLEGAKRAMAEFNGVVLLPATGIKAGASHYLMMKAKLDKVRLPLYMEYIFFFVSLWDFETPWYRQPITF